MNQTRTGCANCYYYSNGRCFFGAPCYGTQMIQINGEWVAVPFPPFDDTKLRRKTMNTSYKCNCCAKESVCKYCVEYQQDCEKLKKEVIGRTTELTIKCKEFMPKEQATLKG